jgi:hypothetical protein
MTERELRRRDGHDMTFSDEGSHASDDVNGLIGLPCHQDHVRAGGKFRKGDYADRVACGEGTWIGRVGSGEEGPIDRLG